MIFTYEAIGLARTPFVEKEQAPRQAQLAKGIEGRLELFPKTGMADAVLDLEGWERLIVLFHFHRDAGFRPKVQPPRSSVKRGVLATRSPHRPNPIGLSVVRLVRASGLTLHVQDLDLLDETPLLDIKPYVPYADAFPGSRTGWLQQEDVTGADGGPASFHPERPVDPVRDYEVAFAARATRAVEWLAARGVDLDAPLRRTLALGPKPHAYRRIRADGDAFVLAHKDWRARFELRGDRGIEVIRIFSGYRPKDRAADPSLGLHRDFAETFGE